VAFSSGTAALHGAAAAAGLGPGDEVVTTPMTFAAPYNASVAKSEFPFISLDFVPLEEPILRSMKVVSRW